MLDTTKLYSLISFCVTSMITQGHRATGKLELVQLFYCNDSRSNSNIHEIDFVRKVAVKKSCKHGEYGLFDHLLCL